METLIFFIMIFCHIVDDYYLQGILAQMKQKSWWKEHAPDPMYQYDYVVALIMHSFSWAFCIMLAPCIYSFHKLGGITSVYILLFMINMCIHAYVDNIKANKKEINLIIDQTIHILQIMITWMVYLSDICMYT